MSDSLFANMYNPDVLSCLANLSNDEVFTPPEIANQMLDLLPQELFTSPDTKFLDPACKSGVFLREIAKRLIEGLKDTIPDLQERIDHIFHNQLYGIAITELTSLLSRRGVYCSKYPNSKYSVSKFNDAEGNIRYKRVNHTFKNGRCVYCGASATEYDRDKSLETHAYELIHTKNPEEIFNMKFDVIIGNPPYQLSDGGNGASAKPIYHHFIQKAIKLQPRFLTMIIPARWYAGGKGLDDFRDSMLKNNNIRVLHDFINANDCFSGVEIKGGVCYFLWDRENPGTCQVNTHIGNEIVSSMDRALLETGSDTFIRYNDAISILHKVQRYKEKTMDTIVSPRKPFGFPSNFRDYSKNENAKEKLYVFAQKDRGFISRKIVEKNIEWIDMWKVYIPEAIGAGNMQQDIIKPLVGAPNTVCTETYVVVGPFQSEELANNVVKYVNTKFFHFLLGLKKITQHTTSKTYSFIPMQDFTKSWTDKELYKKYNLTQEEIEFIEKSIWPDKEESKDE